MHLFTLDNLVMAGLTFYPPSPSLMLHQNPVSSMVCHSGTGLPRFSRNTGP